MQLFTSVGSLTSKERPEEKTMLNSIQTLTVINSLLIVGVNLNCKNLERSASMSIIIIELTPVG